VKWQKTKIAGWSIFTLPAFLVVVVDVARNVEESGLRENDLGRTICFTK
jgi:hypothetical protein